MYLPKYGVSSMTVWDLRTAEPDTLEPLLLKQIKLSGELVLGPGGKRIDRWTPASPLIWDGLAYQIDIYHSLFVVELKSGKTLYRKDVELDGLMHYNAVPVAASPALVGQHVFVCDNQGTTVVMEPGPAYKLVARNQIATVVDRTFPIPAQETLTYAPPIADGGRLYLRGEAYLYCIGEK
jgi:hypothetical protein